MKNYLDLASKEPLRISRRTREAYILVSGQRFSKLQQGQAVIQQRLIALDPRVAAGDRNAWIPRN